jgi:dienelactone hydrolase
MDFARKGLLAGAVLLGAIAVAYGTLHEYVRAATFLVRAANLRGLPSTAANLQADPVSTRDLRVPSRGGDLPARWYRSAGARRDPILLVPGVHGGGQDEPRLVAVARDLAAVGHPVLTIELEDLKEYRLSVRSTDAIEDAAAWLAQQPELAPNGRAGMLGISFAGGLSIVAASRRPVADRVEFVMSFGGHGDLPRTLRYLCTGILPDGSARPPHDYGVAIILLNVAERVVPPEQVQALRQGIRTFLHASQVDMVDPAKAREIFARARVIAEQMPEPAQTYMQYVNDRNVARLGPVLLPHISTLAGHPALSPARSPAPSAPVYLLHGSGDNVIPAMESELLAKDLRARDATVYQLITPLITHAEVNRPPSVEEVWHLVRFWGRMLDE